MGVEIVNRIYRNPYKVNSEVDFLLGNAGDWQELQLDVSFSASKVFTVLDSLTITDPNILTLNNGKHWKDLGFYVGLEVMLKFDYIDTTVSPVTTSTNYLGWFTILALSGSELRAGDSSGNPVGGWGFQYGSIAPMQGSGFQIGNVHIQANVRPQGINVTYGHILNTLVSSGNLASHIDGTITNIIAENTDVSVFGDVVDFTHQLNFKSGLSLESATISYEGLINNGREFKYNYTIRFYYMISPFFDDVNNFVNMVAPDSCLGVQSLTDNFHIMGQPRYNDPNISIQNDPKKTEQEGTTGWFDENYNQLPNPYTHTPVVYKNAAGTIVTELDYANPVTLTTTISGTTLTGMETLQYGFVWAPLEEEIWKSNDYPTHKNLKVSSGARTTGLVSAYPLSAMPNVPFPSGLNLGYSIDGLTGMDISDVLFKQSGNDVLVSLTFRPQAGFTTYMESIGANERNYAVWVSIGDAAANINQSDRVSLLLDYRQLDTYLEPIGSYDNLTIDLLTHPQTATDTPILLNDYRVEDDLLAKVSFQVDTAVGDTIPIVNGINFGVLIENNTTGVQYVLDKSEVDLSSFPDATQYNFSQPRSFEYGAGNSKNYFKVSYDATTNTGTEKGALGEYGFKIRWEDWIEKFPHASNDFYDNTLNKNGFNNDWYDYFNTSDYSLYFFAEIKAVLNGVNVLYQNKKNMPIYDYDVNTTISTVFKYYQDNAGVKGTLLTGSVVFEGEFVWLDIIYTSTGTPWVDQADVDARVWATQKIDIENGSQLSLRQLSSIWASENDNPMVGIPTVALSTITWNATNQITVSTRIEANKLINSPTYKVTGRIGCL